MIKSKLHNPIIAKNSHLENAVIEKVNLTTEKLFSDLGNVVPVVPETGRIWFNTESGTFKFANVGDGKNYVDEFLSRTDTRIQSVAGKLHFNDTVTINNSTNGSAILTVDSATQQIKVNATDLNITTLGNLDTHILTNSNETVDGNKDEVVGGSRTTSVTASSIDSVSGNRTITTEGMYSFTASSNATSTYNANKTESVLGNASITVANTLTESVKNKTTNVTGDVVETVAGTINISSVGNVVEIYSADQSTTVTGNLGLKVGTELTVTDLAGNVKLSSNNTTNTVTLNYSNVSVNGQVETHTLSNKFVVNNGSTDKFVLDNTNDKASVVYKTVEVTGTTVTTNVTGSLTLTDGSANKVVADNVNNSLTINYGEVTVTGNTTVDGNMVITGDLTIGGQTTKVDIAAENMTIADNVIILNSNLTNEDPRLASAIVDGTNVDNNAGVAVNRGNQGVLDLIKWVESADTTTSETLKLANAQVSIWNFEAATPSYELHQILDAYTAGRQVKDKSGTSWIGYDGNNGVHYTAAINAGETPEDALDYTYKLDAGKLDASIDSIVQEIDTIKFNTFNTVRVGETPSAGTSFTINHNLGTVFVDVRIQREEDGKWYFDVLPTQVVDANTVKIETTESTKIRYMIKAIEGFDVNHANDLTIS